MDALQWGRGRRAAEIGYLNDIEKEGLQASMGPRPKGRGNEPADEASQAMLDASMGPRPKGRGNITDRGACGTPITASMGPRPKGRGNDFRDFL